MTAFEIGGIRVQVSGSGALHTTPINLTVKEVDGSPSAVGVTTIKVPNGLLTDNGDGSVTLASPSDVGFANPMTTAGDLILGGVSGAAGRLAKGSDSTVLTMSASTHLPVWAAASGGTPTSIAGTGGTASFDGSGQFQVVAPHDSGFNLFSDNSGAINLVDTSFGVDPDGYSVELYAEAAVGGGTNFVLYVQNSVGSPIVAFNVLADGTIALGGATTSPSIRILPTGEIVLVGLPTSAPSTPGALWRDELALNVLKQVHI